MQTYEDFRVFSSAYFLNDPIILDWPPIHFKIFNIAMTLALGYNIDMRILLREMDVYFNMWRYLIFSLFIFTLIQFYGYKFLRNYTLILWNLWIFAIFDGYFKLGSLVTVHIHFYNLIIKINGRLNYQIFWRLCYDRWWIYLLSNLHLVLHHQVFRYSSDRSSWVAFSIHVSHPRNQRTSTLL